MKRNILIGFLIGGISYAVASQFWPKKDSRKSAEKANFSAVLSFESPVDKSIIELNLESWSWGANSSDEGLDDDDGKEAGQKDKETKEPKKPEVMSQDFNFVVLSSSKSALLLQAMAKSQNFASVNIKVKSKLDKIQSDSTSLEMNLVNAKVSSFQTGGSGFSEIDVSEQISFHFGKLSYAASDKAGTTKIEM